MFASAVLRKTRLGVGAAVAFGLLAGALTASQVQAQVQAPAKTKVVVGSATVVTTPLGCYYSSLPMELFWKDEGIEVEYIGLAGANAAIQALDAGTVDVVPGTNSALFALFNKYPDAQVKAFFTHTTAFNAVPVVLSDSPIKSITDLQGKNFGVQSLANSQVPVLKALLAQAGGDPASLKFLAVGEGPEAAHALTEKRVDALALFDGLHASIEASGIPLRAVTSESFDRDRLGFNAALWARAGYIKDKRDVLVRLGRGVAKGVVFAKTNPEAAVRIHWKVFPATKPRGVSDGEAIRRSLMNLDARLANIDIVDGLVGNSTAQQVNGYMNLMIAGGILGQPIPVGNFWDASLLKEINNFDHEAVRKQAREWKG